MNVNFKSFSTLFREQRATGLMLTMLGIVALGMALLGPAGPAFADDRRDHEIARRALLEGRIRPLAEIRKEVAPKLPGKILGVEFEVNDYGRLVYEFDVVTPGGLLKEVDVDAKTGEIVSIEAGG